MRLEAIVKVPVERLPKLFERDFDALVAAAIADATRALAPGARQLLRSAEWWQDWSDALLCAEGELRVAVERFAYLGDPRLGRIEFQLKKVRTRMNEARVLAHEHRRREHEASAATQGLSDTRATALAWLTRAFVEEYDALRSEVLAEQGAPPERRQHPPSRDVFDSLNEAYERGWIVAPMTPQAAALLALDPVSFRRVVADDVRDQNDRSLPLRHPAVLHRWNSALIELLDMTAGQARTRSDTLSHLTTEDLRSLDETTARKTLNARRFFTAVQQRKAECGSVIRQFMRVAEQRKREDPRELLHFKAERTARERLAQAHPVEFEHVVESLRVYEESPGRLDTARLTVNLRGELKAHVVRELRIVAGLTA